MKPRLDTTNFVKAAKMTDQKTDRIEYDVRDGRGYDDVTTRQESVDDWARWLLMDVRSVDARLEITTQLCELLIPVLLKQQPDMVGKVASILGCEGMNHRMVPCEVKLAASVPQNESQRDLEHTQVRVVRDVCAEGYNIPEGTAGTIVHVFEGGRSFEVEFTELSKQEGRKGDIETSTNVVVILSIDQIEIMWRRSGD